MQRRQPAQRRRQRELGRAVEGLVPRQQGGAPSLEPGTLLAHRKFRVGQLGAQSREHGGVAADAPGQEHPPQRTPPFFQQRHHLVGHAVMQCVEDVRRRGLVPVQLVGDVRLAVDGAAGSQRHDLSLQGELDGRLDPQPHPANLLDKKLAAAGGALVMRKDIGDPAAAEKINQEGLAPQRGDGIEILIELPQGRAESPQLRSDGPTAPTLPNAPRRRMGAGQASPATSPGDGHSGAPPAHPSVRHPGRRPLPKGRRC